ncbi:hypothetical protein B0H16DRAFT_1451464 [Mycena metata]|uniref:Uncharacterized protein n=1 Tax=Mycena metata TaxID=1033252 RepID=A0AAD7NRP0_9AGAR|nr:hypothetical protein B0H16DRAFT_1451464 [Mycena metata]
MPLPTQNGIVRGFSADDRKFRCCNAGLFPSLGFGGIGRYEVNKRRGNQYYLVTTSKNAYVFTDPDSCNAGQASLKSACDVTVCQGLVETAQEIYHWCSTQHNHGHAERRSVRLEVLPQSDTVSPWSLTTYVRGAQFHPWIPPKERSPLPKNIAQVKHLTLPEVGPRKSAREHVKSAEALKYHGEPVTPRLEQWLAHYNTPRRAALYARVAARERVVDNSVKPRETLVPSTTTSATRCAKLYARVAARKKRMDDLLELRAGAIAKSLTRPIPPPCHPAVERVRIAREKEQEIAQKAVEREVERAAQSKATKALIDELTEVRARAGRHDQLDYGLLPSLMPRALTADVWWRVAHFAPERKHLDLVRLSKGIYDLIIPMIYGDIDIGRGAFPLRALSGEQSPSSAPRMSSIIIHLRLPLTSDFSFPLNILPRITFSLTTFGSHCSVVGSWAALIASQPTIVQLKLNSDYYLSPPGPAVLPALHAVQGRPADLARFARHHALEDLWFFIGPPHGRRSLKAADIAIFAKSPPRLVTVRLSARQFILLVNFAPAMMATLQHIVFDECPEWSEFTRTPSLVVVRGHLAQVAQQINQCAPLLRSMLLAFSQNVSHRHPAIRPLLRADGAFFLNSFNAITPVPHFKTLRVYASDGCTTWENWGSSDQTTSYLPPPPDHGPLELEPDLQSPVIENPTAQMYRYVLAPQGNNLRPQYSVLCSSRAQPVANWYIEAIFCFIGIKEKHEEPSHRTRTCQRSSPHTMYHSEHAMYHPEKKKKRRRSLLPCPTPHPNIPLVQPRRLRHHSAPAPQESATRAQVDLNPEGEASWQEAFSVLPGIVLQWAAGTLPNGDESDDVEDPEIPDLPLLTQPHLADHPDLPDILLTPDEVAERNNQDVRRLQRQHQQRQTSEMAGEAVESYLHRPPVRVEGSLTLAQLEQRRQQDADRIERRREGIQQQREEREAYGETVETSWHRPRRRLEDSLTPAQLQQRRERFSSMRQSLALSRAVRRRETREREEAREREREAQLPGLRRVILDAMRPWEREDFLRVEQEQETQEEGQLHRDTALGLTRRPFDDLSGIAYVE